VTVDAQQILVKYLGNWVHPSHQFIPDADYDNTECATCMCRPYNKEAKLSCLEDSGHGGPDN